MNFNIAQDCSVNTAEYSYHQGVIISALANLYKATGTQSYLENAHSHAKYTLSKFVDSSTGIITDSNCKRAESNCKSPSGFEWHIYRGFAQLYKNTADSDIRDNYSSSK